MQKGPKHSLELANLSVERLDGDATMRTEMTKRAELSFTKPGRTDRGKVAPRKLITVEFDDMDQSYKLPEKLKKDKTPPIPTSPIARSDEIEEI